MDISLLKNREVLLKGKNGSAAILPIGLNEKLDESVNKTDLVLYSSAFTEMAAAAENQKTFNWPGEMEVSGISVNSISLYPGDPNSPLAFTLYLDGFSICYISDSNREIPSEVVEKIGEVDLLILPVTSDSKAPAQILDEIEPKGLIPVADTNNSTYMEAFVKKLALTKPEVKFKLTITNKSELKPESMGLYLLA